MIFLEKLTDGSVAARNFDRLMSLVADFGGDSTTGAPRSVNVRFGSGTIAISAASGGSASVTHGLGTTPVAVIVTTNQTNWFASAQSLTSTTFSAVVREYEAANVTVNVVYYWIAIG